MYDNFSFVRTNLRLMKNHWKNKGAPLGGMGGMGGGTGDRLSWTIILHFFAAYIKAAAYVRPRPKNFRAPRGARGDARDIVKQRNV